MGGLPYNDVQAQTGVPNLIADMNNSDMSFSIHDGDLKAGSGIPGSSTPTTCSDADQDGWNDASGSENADKCAWGPETTNITLGGHQYAVQATWSNQAFDAGKDGCALSR